MVGPAEWLDSSLLRWIVLAPLLTAVANGVMLALVRRPIPIRLVLWASCLSVLGSLVISGVAFARLVGLLGAPTTGAPRILVDALHTWVGVGVGFGAFSADLAFRFDALSAAMCFVVTGVGFLIHLYSVGYMQSDARPDGGVQRFFCYLNLFTASMLVLVLADNLLLVFLGWEGVGVCSYLLIGFWYSSSENARAGSKAFIVNRMGDFGFLVGILLLFWSLADAGSPAVSFRAIEAGFWAVASQTLALPAWLGGGAISLATLIGGCFFLGAVGKSAQLPLHVWLPDAMAGPTPVSALIHAATMVTAGVYLVARLSFVYEASPSALALIAWTGGSTALFAALLAIAQDDIKKVLAYSTISQLGIMFVAIGCGGYTTAVFHLVMHAFFKALLFLAAGAVIVAAHHEQDMQALGGLRKKMKRTWWVTLIGVLSIAGFPGFAGFFSKDEILTTLFVAEDLPGHLALYWMGLATSAITAFYMFRLLFLTFHGKTRLPRARRYQLADPVPVMMWPLYVLAALSVFGGLLGMPQFWGDRIGVEESDSLGNFLASVIATRTPHQLDAALEGQLIGAATAASIAGFGVACVVYLLRPDRVEPLARLLALPRRVLVRRFWVDEAYDLLIVRPLVAVSDRLLYRGIDQGLIDRGLLEGSARLVRSLTANGLKYTQSGLAQAYLLVLVAGTVAVLAYLVA